jgi:hypothetical protein
MRSAIKLFLVLVTVVVILVAWLTKQLENPDIRLLAFTLLAITLAAFFIINLLDNSDEKKRRKKRESKSNSSSKGDTSKVKRAEGNFSLKEKKPGSPGEEATRGTKRKVLGK